MRILFGWEMGMGMGHLSIHRDLFLALKERGHEIHVVARSVGKAARAFQGLDLPIWQAPYDSTRPEPFFEQTYSMAYVLHNSGLTKLDFVLAQTRAWDHILDAVNPELVLIDSAPTLQLALRGRAVPAVMLATGYFIPPVTEQLPVYSVFPEVNRSEVAARDAVLLSCLNAVLRARKQATLKNISALYNEGVSHIFTTFNDLDHYGARAHETYVGVPPSPPGETPEWPKGEGLRVYAYLKPSKTVHHALSALKDSRWPTLIVSDGLPPEVLKHYASSTLRFYKKGLDLVQVAKKCELAVTNANHGTVAQLLLAGIPQILLPLHLEQQLLANRVQEMGAGLVVNCRAPADMSVALNKVHQDASFKAKARAFAERQATIVAEGHRAAALRALSHVHPGV